MTALRVQARPRMVRAAVERFGIAAHQAAVVGEQRP